ncbi:hypothetical protein C0Z18_17805 [Trinickia dabaoshanensis]|uniref:ATP synthase subunit I n=1 Tax=Trinickia dabaoshanensis TaxID=564714 RepID=A0A2N7VLS1_9BURK|nr:ATP synthase subunit I [Trinickia dabaoshanensis]PMS18093.1 hypothetical protein C0Z18_17805 [Trinickia dabaoshanensis]
MTIVSASSIAAQIAAGAVVGCGAGAAYFGTLHMNARSYARHAIGVAIALQMVRFGALGLVLYGLARLGPAALLAGLGGVVIARHVAVRFSRHAP